MDKFNNFYFLFPGGAYRKYEEKSKICASLDGVLAELNFNINLFNEIKGRIMSQMHRTIELCKSPTELTPQEQKEIEVITLENAKDNQLFEELIEPVYSAMISLGYSSKELCG